MPGEVIINETEFLGGKEEKGDGGCVDCQYDVLYKTKSSAIGLSISNQSIKANDTFSKHCSTHVCSGSGPTNQFLGPVRTVRMCLHSRNHREGTQIQTHCGEETSVRGRGEASRQIGRKCVRAVRS
jgi:hypothetical protein